MSQLERNMQKQLLGTPRESRESPGQRYSNPSANSTRKSFMSFFGGNGNDGFSPGSLKKSGLSNSRLSLSIRSNQSISGIKSDYNVVESFGSPLPVAVNEALTFKEGSCNVSAKCAQNGWAWVVQGRRLLIWQYKESSQGIKTGSPPRSLKPQRRGGSLAQCRELTLPHSDIGHKSSLVSVFQTEGQQMASCIAVSAPGDVRFWVSIAHDGNSVDLTNILDGQEFVQLLNLPAQNGYLAVTTTCNLVFLRVCLTNGRYTLHHKAIKPATSFLGGFGKKFASILIGMNNSGEKDQLLVGMCSESNSNDGQTIVAVLSDRSLQRWCLSNKGSTEQLIYEDVQLVDTIRKEFQQKFWNVRLSPDNVEIEMHLLDFHVFKGKAYILAGAVNAAHAPQMCYAVVMATADTDCMRLESFTPLKLNKFYMANTMQDCLSLRFIVSSTHIYLYTSKVVYPLHLLNTAPTGEPEAEKVEFHQLDDRILCAAICNHIPLFLSRTHGLVSITPGDFDSTEVLNMSTCNTPDLFAPASFYVSSNLHEQSTLSGSCNKLNIFELDPDDVYSEMGDEVCHLKAAFLYSLKRNNKMANTVINELNRRFSESDPDGTPVDAYKLDRAVIGIAEDLAEDLPIFDPRWEDACQDHDINRHGLGSSRSMQIITQLRDKSTALQHFIEFLHSNGFWDKLNVLPNGSNMAKPTCYILADISEKIVAAIALRTIQSKMPKPIDAVIEATVAQWDEKPQGSLTVQDIFYVKLCKFQHIFEAFVDVADECVATQEQTTATVAQFILDINSIVLHILGEVLKYREQNAGFFMPASNKVDSYENLPWTAVSGRVGARDSLTRLIDITLRYAAHSVNEINLKQNMYQQMVELTDIVLDGRKNYLESVRDVEKYNVLQQQFEAHRNELISILIKDKQYEYAAKLAEKFLDFQSLVIICDETNDKERLEDYTRKFEDFDFSQFAINWHLRQKRPGEVFERFKGNQSALAQFMRDHPSLGWIQLMFNGDFERAGRVLFELGQNETEFAARKKSMLALAKLAVLAAADPNLTPQIDQINADLLIIEYQEHLGHDVLQSFGFDATDQKVLKVEEIINLYITEENETANEFDFRKALELLNFVDQPYDMRHKVWCAAIKRDNWSDYDPNNAVDYMQQLLFFKVIKVSKSLGQDSDSFLPPIEDFLDSSELGNLPQQKSFQYLLKLTYEYVADLFKQPDESMEM
ncbi:nuclear pore complex protein Nup133 [Scaptodrosophila lebanonensis]|uniref:Nuclear pore complex protein Nup133 n=1 Tax=Drosophila lebanonensis TaxID=7225 RepID=A0A6J2T3D4_DROLE|nr:nuclear pore complex protein Nup133 [Scaptodrosophila lebanonensis]